MHLVKTYLAPSSINGVGVFAGEDIPKGTPVWEYTPNFDLKIPAEGFDAMPELAKAYLIKHGFLWQNYIYLCSDYGQFTNHSDTPNTGNGPDGFSEIALCDIKQGEEITSNYRTFNENYRDKTDLFGNQETATKDMIPEKT